LEFGAIVEFETDLEGMIHVSELEHTRVNKPSDVLSIGQEVEAQVLGVDAGKRKISLSRKALLESPTPEPSPTPAAPKKKRAKPLRGGLASHFDW
jgi:small subunit ribosomal protein S1